MCEPQDCVFDFNEIWVDSAPNKPSPRNFMQSFFNISVSFGFSNGLTCLDRQDHECASARARRRVGSCTVASAEREWESTAQSRVGKNV